jgi:hypothetical protein
MNTQRILSLALAAALALLTAGVAGNVAGQAASGPRAATSALRALIMP